MENYLLLIVSCQLSIVNNVLLDSTIACSKNNAERLQVKDRFWILNYS